MVKSDLQLRAENAAQLFASARKTVVIEFAGVPKAGKTSTIGQVQAFLKRCGFRVEVVVERASVCPIRDKKHSNFNVWTACTTLAQVLEKTQVPPRFDDPDILILDRGLFDSISWFTFMERLARIRAADREIIERFLRLDDWRKRVSAVIVMTARPNDSMEREKGYLPVENSQGSIMNSEVLQQMLDTTLETATKLEKDFRVFVIDTSSVEYRGKPKLTAERVADVVLSVIEEQLQEDILCLPKTDVLPIFSDRIAIASNEAEDLVKSFTERGRFRPRHDVEQDLTVLQALPIVIVRNKSGDVLRLRRRERSADNPLHEKIVIWAGGHVRKEDGANGSSIVQCVLRELREELRLSMEPTELVLLGAVYANSGGTTSKHVALVYEWRAETDDVAVALSSSEFFERRGTSLSGSFVTLENLAKDVKSEKITEVWSSEIVRNLLPKTSVEFHKRLI